MRSWRPTRLVSDLVELESRVEAELERGRYGKRTRRSVMLELLGVINGSSRFERIPRLVPDAERLTDRIVQRIGGESEHAVARAIYENAYFGTTIENAIHRGAIHGSEWAFVSKLSKALEVSPSYGQDKLEDPPSWKIDVDESHQTMRVWIRELALQDMLLASMEAFWVPAGSGKPSTEIYGIVFGSYRTTSGQPTTRHQESQVDLNVERVCIQHRAQGSPSEVFADIRSEATQLEMGEELFPYWHLLGDFHTHTYASLDKLYAVRGWEYSKYDEEVNIEWCGRLREMGHRPRVALIITLCRAARQGQAYQESWQGKPHVVRTSIGRCHVFIAAYRIRPDGHYSTERLSLKCPHLAGR